MTRNQKMIKNKIIMFSLAKGQNEINFMENRVNRSYFTAALVAISHKLFYLLYSKNFSYCALEI